MTLQIRKDISINDVYTWAKKEKSAEARARMTAIAAVLEGKQRSQAAKIAGVTVNNLRTWIKRFNENGLDDLSNKKSPGSPSTWTDEIIAFLSEKAHRGATFENDGRVAYRLKDFQCEIEKKFNIRYGISSIWYKLKELNLSWITTRQQHPKTDLQTQEEFKKKNPRRNQKNSRPTSN